MNKLYYSLFILSILTFSACFNSDEPTVTTITDDDWISEDGRVVIQLGGYDGVQTSITRSPILDDSSNFFYDISSLPASLNTVGIYALAPQEEWNNSEAILLNNVEALGTTTKKNIADGAINDGLNKLTLRTSESQEWGGIYYYPMVSKYNYSFYAYAPYNKNQATISTANTTATISYDGSQDIMWATCSASSVNANEIYINENYDKNSNSLEGYNAKYIRQLKYHYELNEAAQSKGKDKLEGNHPWVPNLEFQHKLVWLKFAIVVATNQSQLDKIAATELKVKDITLLNHGKTAKIDMLTGNVTISGTEDLKMKNKNGDKYEDNDAGNEYNPENGSVTVRGYLLVKPANTYDIQLTVIPKDNPAGSTPPSQTFTITLKQDGDATFEAGKSYLIKLGVYAMQEVEATASVTKWGDDIPLDIPVE